MNDAEFLADRWVKSEVEQLSLVLVSAVDPVDRRDGIDLVNSRLDPFAGECRKRFPPPLFFPPGTVAPSLLVVKIAQPGPNHTRRTPLAREAALSRSQDRSNHRGVRR